MQCIVSHTGYLFGNHSAAVSCLTCFFPCLRYILLFLLALFHQSWSPLPLLCCPLLWPKLPHFPPSRGGDRPSRRRPRVMQGMRYEEVQTAEGKAFFAIVIRRRLEQFCSCYVYINVSIRHYLPCQPLFPPNPETVYRFPYSVCRIPYARVTPLPSLTPFPFPFPYLQLHSTSSLVPTMLLLWVFSSLFFRFFLIYQLQSVMWLTFGNTGSINQRLVTLFCGHSDRSVKHSLIKLNLIADKVMKKRAS